ncbi:MAG: hypothetical protein FWD66_00020 [Paludibacter sp.]|nr:hypothetical protein [Paludibacter sp.]
MNNNCTNLGSQNKRNGRLRTHSHTFMLNDDENRFFMQFLEKYNIENKARFVRQTLICVMLTKTEEDHPTLF